MIDIRASVQSVSALAAAAFVLNFAWEMVQAPWFADMAGLSLWKATLRCLLAAVGDVAISLVAYAVVAAWVRETAWLRHSSKGYVAVYWMVAFGVSTLIERHAVATGRWQYVSEMPLVPWLEIGMAPVAQWLVIPWLSFALARRVAGSRP